MPEKSNNELIKSLRGDSLNESFSSFQTETVTINPPPTIVSGINVSTPQNTPAGSSENASGNNSTNNNPPQS